jgi:hypothetical protein
MKSFSLATIFWMRKRAIPSNFHWRNNSRLICTLTCGIVLGRPRCQRRRWILPRSHGGWAQRQSLLGRWPVEGGMPWSITKWVVELQCSWPFRERQRETICVHTVLKRVPALLASWVWHTVFVILGTEETAIGLESSMNKFLGWHPNRVLKPVCNLDELTVSATWLVQEPSTRRVQRFRERNAERSKDKSHLPHHEK